MNNPVVQLTRTHAVTPGDTLASLAVHYYGDAGLATELARVNGIAKSAILTAGSSVKIPHPSMIRRASPLTAAQPAQIGSNFWNDIAAQGSIAPVAEKPIPTFAMPALEVTAPLPWYFKPRVWVMIAGAGLLAYFLLRPSRR